jgi:hypothetical protein
MAGVASAEPGKSRIVRIEVVERISPAFNGRSFGNAGQYEWVRARAHALADPASPRNGGVVDLAFAPRNAQGLVEYSFDVAFIKPVAPEKANGTTILEVTNRGRPILQTSLLGGNGDVKTDAGAGKATILEQGATLVWTGWQSDIDPGPGVMTATYPVATDNGKVITAIVRDEIALDGSSGAQIAPVAADATSFEARLYYSLADSSTKPMVRVRQRADDTPITLPADQLEILGPNRIRVRMKSDMDRGALYEVEYRARDPKVMGLSFVSLRDLMSSLKQNSEVARELRAAVGVAQTRVGLATGLSQSGRYLRDFVYQDFNLDETGQMVFDGVIPQGSGAKRGFFNHRFAQPGRAPDFQHEMRGYPGADFPYSYAETQDPVSGKTEGLLTRCTASKSCPKIIHLDSDWEQWQQAGSLIGTDWLGRNIGFPDNVRAFLVASTPHASLPPNAGIRPLPQTPARTICEQTLNPLTWSAVLRASMANMEQWVQNGIEPPTSRYPAGPEQGRVSIDTLRNGYPAIPGHQFSPLYGKLQVVDFKSNPPRAVSSFAPYAILFPRLNADGNGIDGVVLPEIAVPVATYSGRNTRADGYARGELCHTQGSYMPFARTAVERKANGDSRLSIEERYRDESEYRARLITQARYLVAERLMLEVDAERYANAVLP